MGCCALGGETAEERAANKINEDIKKDLRKEKESRDDEHRILILGCGEAGKSTFIKQMQIIHSDGLGNEEKRKDKKPLIADNIMSAILTLISEMSFVQENQLHDNDELANAVARVGKLEDQNNTPEIVFERADDIKLLWESEPIQITYTRRSEFQIVECAKYFLSKVHEVLSPDYVPTDQDLLQTRQRTVGIVEYKFEMDGGGRKRTLIMIDVGGQRGERKKWIHFFNDVNVLMFLTAISEYDQVLQEDLRTNRMRESVNLFSTILNYQWFQKTPVVLFLNKMDLLKEKIESGKSPVSNFFPECHETDFDGAVNYFRQLFVDQNPNPEERDVYPHVTCAIDPKNIKVVDTAVQVVIMNTILGATALT